MSSAPALAARSSEFNEPRALAVLVLFGLGIAMGVVLHALVDRGPAENPYPSLPKVQEPNVAHDVVTAISSDDPRSLSKLLTQEQLNDLGTALRPITAVRSTKFVGAVESQGRYLAGYLATGKDDRGNDFIVGFVLRIANDQVVGVN